MTSSDGSPPIKDSQPSARWSRRGLILGTGGLLALGALGGARWFNVAAEVDGTDLTVQDAHQAAVAGSITLVDIRRPDEWATTGIGEGAVPIDMRSEDFIDTLLMRTQGRRDAPVALICARGVRSARMSARLQEAGFTRIIDVPEGMLGSGAGPGWIRAGLPVVKPE